MGKCITPQPQRAIEQAVLGYLAVRLVQNRP